MKKNPVFIHVPKNAGTSIRSALKIRHRDGENKTTHVSWSSSLMHEWYRATENPVLIACVRHPCARALSVYQHFHRSMRRANATNDMLQIMCRAVSASEFWERFDIEAMRKHVPHVRTQYSFLEGSPMDILLRFENLSVDWRRVAAAIGRPGYPLPHKNSTERVNWREHLSDDARRNIRRLFAVDFREYDYEDDI